MSEPGESLKLFRERGKAGEEHPTPEVVNPSGAVEGVGGLFSLLVCLFSKSRKRGVRRP